MQADLKTPLTVWTHFLFSDELEEHFQQGLGPHRLLRPDTGGEWTLGESPSDPQAREADVLYGQPAVSDVIEGKAKWIAVASAGYTRYDTDAVRSALAGRGAILTNASGVYDEPCAQHALALILAEARQLPACFAHQREGRWDKSIRAGSTLLGGQLVLMYGYGAIARRLVELLKPLGLEIIGVRRRPRGDEAVRCISVDEADEVLPKADWVVNILPAGPSSEGYFDGSRLRKLKPSASYLSIGRGTTTDQTALRELLEAGLLRSAYLDVTDPEPLPAGDPLWQTPRCTITPHSAGGFRGETRRLADHFLANLVRFARGERLSDVVMA